jgi:hypothetical protein
MKSNLILLLITLISICCTSQNSFEICIDSDEDEIFVEAAKDSFGNILLAGGIGEFTTKEYDAYIMKIFPDGSYFTKRFDRIDTICELSTINILSNGSYFLTGSFSDSNNYFKKDNLWVCILDEDLNVLIEKSYKVDDFYIAIGGLGCSLIDNDGNIVVVTMAGYKDPPNTTTFVDLALFKFNPEGDTLVSKYYHYLWNEIPFEIRQMPNSDNLMLIDCAINELNHNELLFLDKDLNILYYNMFGNNYFGMTGQYCSSQYWCSDTSFLMSTDNHWDNDDLKDEEYIAVYLVDTAANIHQELVLNKPDTADYSAWHHSMAYANDSTIYIGGFQIYLGFWMTDPTIVELYMIDKNMNLLGYKELGGDANYEVWGILATDDDGCLVYGTCYDNPNGEPERDIHIWKVLRDNINLITSIETLELPEKSAKVWPNPALDELFISLDQFNSLHEIKLQIYNISGRKMTDRKIMGQGNVIKISVTNLDEGTYIFNVATVNGEIKSGKFIKQ